MEKQGSHGVPIWGTELGHWEESDLMVPIAVTPFKQDVDEIRSSMKIQRAELCLGPQACVLLELIHMGRVVGGSRFAAHGTETWGQTTLSPVPLLQLPSSRFRIKVPQSNMSGGSQLESHLLCASSPSYDLDKEQHHRMLISSPTPLWIHIYSYAMFPFHLPYGFSKKTACISFLTM